MRGFTGEGCLERSTRIVILLRLSKMLGCPVCRALFPKLAPSAGLDAAAVDSAIRGDGAGLAAEAAAAIAWVGAVMAADGDEPRVVPEEAQSLSPAQRAHLLQAVRIKRVVHATGLLFLPHALVERAAPFVLRHAGFGDVAPGLSPGVPSVVCPCAGCRALPPRRS